MRPYQEDAFCLCPNALEDCGIVGVYDGHGGDKTSRYVAANIVEYLAKHEADLLSQKDAQPNLDAVARGLANSYLAIDKSMRDQNFFEDDSSGCTAVTAFISKSHISVANCGDSRCILSRDGAAVPLSIDHKPVLPKEKARITKAGGFVIMKRVNGDLAVSRALGDFAFKKTVELPPEEQQVTGFPEVLHHKRDVSKDEFLLMCSDGVWDVMSNQQAITFVRECLAREESPHQVLNSMLDECLHKRRSRDNMSIVLVDLRTH